jgi:adenylate cyclase
MPTDRGRLRLLLFALAALAGAGLGLVCYATNAFRSLELKTIDTRFSIRGDRTPPSSLVVVAVDDATFHALGDERWPFTHDLHARVIDRISRDGAKVIALDIQFSEPSNTNRQTYALLDSIYNAGNVVASTTEVDDRGNGYAFQYYTPPPKVEKSRAPEAINRWLNRELKVTLAYGSFPNDPGGVLRRINHDANGLESFSVAVAEKAEGRKIDASELGGDSAWIDFYGPPDTIPHVRYSDVYLAQTERGREGRQFRKKVPRGFFRDKIVVIGSSSQVNQDVHPTPTSGDREMAGPEIQAHAIGTAMAGFPLQEPSTIFDVLLIVFMGVVTPAASLALPALRAVALAVVLGGIYAVVTQLLFNGDTILPFVYPLVALAISAVGALAVHYVTEAFERQRTRDMFGRFVPESVVGQVLEQADGLRLGGVAREATVMFSDLRGFTSFAESLDPDQVITILNRYLTAMVDDAILPHGGTLVDYMGDGIMAVFGAPIEMDDHADRALAAARAKLTELGKFSDWLREEMGFEKAFLMGIGLNTGRVMSGNVGSERRLAYTAIGDTTNTAARLEAMTKDSGYMIFMSDSTREALSEQPEDLVFVDDFEVRGREQRVKIWSVEESDKGARAAAAFQSVSKG